jgi:acetylornithine/succinyldiaminopimelate/putrescine aminotransferase
MAAMKVLLKEKLIQQVHAKEFFFRELLQHPKIIALRSRGLLFAVEFESEAFAKKVISRAINMPKDSDRVLTDWFLFAPHCMRIAPPLSISQKDIKKACRIIRQAIEMS